MHMTPARWVRLGPRGLSLEGGGVRPQGRLALAPFSRAPLPNETAGAGRPAA